MRVRLIQPIASRHGCHAEGAELDVESEVAEIWAEHGVAEVLGRETASVSAPENEAAPRPRGRPRAGERRG